MVILLVIVVVDVLFLLVVGVLVVFTVISLKSQLDVVHYSQPNTCLRAV